MSWPLPCQPTRCTETEVLSDHFESHATPSSDLLNVARELNFVFLAVPTFTEPLQPGTDRCFTVRCCRARAG